MKTTTRLNKYLVMLLGGIIGVILLCSLSFFQKKIIGAPIVSKGFIVPISFGAVVGVLLGYYIYRLQEVINRLSESEKRCRAIYNGSHAGVVLINKAGILMECNQSFNQMLGYKDNELCAKNALDLILAEESIFEKYKEIYNQLEVDGSPACVEVELITKSEEKLPVEVSLYKMILDKNLINWAVIRDITDKKRIEQKVFKAMVGAEENERERYSKELHDGLGPLLSTAMIYSHAIYSDDNLENHKKYIVRIKEILEETIQTIRGISNNLSHDALNRYGIVEAVKSFTERLKPVTNISFYFNSNLENRFNETVEFTLYRTLIELINNTIKHAEASKVKIDLSYKNEFLEVLYKDDGKGFEYEEKIKKLKGFGLANLEGRIKKIGGQYNYKTKPGNGVAVNIKLQLSGN